MVPGAGRARLWSCFSRSTSCSLYAAVLPICIEFGNTDTGDIMYRRIIDLTTTLEKRSLFLFGPRATGKSTLVRHQLPDARIYDLLDNETYARLLRRPKLMEEETHRDTVIVIDEIQKLPSLLDEAHRLIANRNQRFVLTGSSARKLKHGAANLLAGRARKLELFPLVQAEIPEFSLESWMRTGGLPFLYGEPDAPIDLTSYVDLYLREEVQAEALIRNVQSFAHLLDALALMNGQELNYASIGSDTGIPARTVEYWIQILEDTLLAFRLPVFQKTQKRKATSRPKLWFFDIGVVNALRRSFPERPGPEYFGTAFEHLIVLETRAWMSYRMESHRLSWWRSRSGLEVDLLIGDRAAVEVKATELVTDKHLKGLRALREDLPGIRAVVVSRDPERRSTSDGIEILPWRVYLDELRTGTMPG